MKGIETLGVIIVSQDVYVVIVWVFGVINALILIPHLFIKLMNRPKKETEEEKEKYRRDLEVGDWQERERQKMINFKPNFTQWDVYHSNKDNSKKK